MEERDVLFAGDVVRSLTQDLNNNVGRSKYRLPIGNDLGALVGVLRVGIPSFDSRPGLHVNFETCFGEGRENGRYQRNPPLSGINLFRNTDDQESPACSALDACNFSRLEVRPAGASEELRILDEPNRMRK